MVQLTWLTNLEPHQKEVYLRNKKDKKIHFGVMLKS